MARVPPQMALLAGNRLHLQHGPIDLIVQADGDAAAVKLAYDALIARFSSILDELSTELPLLRRPAGLARSSPAGPVALRMRRAVLPYAASAFITPMAAVAGAVADEALQALCRAASLRRAYVNNGGDIALYLAADCSFRIGLVDRPDRPGLFATTTITAADGIGGVATSGWRGRSFSLGIADAVTVCAATAAQADAAATIIANAVDLPGHPAITRIPANTIQHDTDLGARLVTRQVGPLAQTEIAHALASGLARAHVMIQSGQIKTAALNCQGQTRTTDPRRAGCP